MFGWLPQLLTHIEIVLLDARVTGYNANVLVHAEGVSPPCASLGGCVVHELQGNPQARFYGQTYVDNMMKLKARGMFGEEWEDDWCRRWNWLHR